MIDALAAAWGGVRARPGRSALGGLGVALAATMLATAVVVGYGLETGFDRSAQAADLPDVIVRFDPQPLDRVASRIRALPNLAAASYRFEMTDATLESGTRSAGNGVIEVIGPGRRGYAIVAGRDLSARGGGVVVEQGVAQAWDLHVGSRLAVAGLGSLQVVGIALGPDDVAFPLAAPRVYVSRATFAQGYGSSSDPQVSMAQLWVRDRRYLEETLVQARATSYGVRGLRVLTRDGVAVLHDDAAGIVISLLVALSAAALLTVALMLAAAARAEVQRRLTQIGVRRSVGETRARLALVTGLEALIVAAPAAALGILVAALLATGPSDRLLSILNELPPGGALVLPLAACWAFAAAIPTIASMWPAWRFGARSPVALLRGAELRPRTRRRTSGISGGLGGLGARLVVARRVRLVATLALVGASTAFILLMLALASELKRLQSDPGALGRRYQLTASLPAQAAQSVRAIPGVAAAAPRYEVEAIDSYSLGETIELIGYRGDHTAFEAPPLAAGRRLRSGREAEVGSGLAAVLGLSVGSPLAIQLASGRELRFRVAGIVRALQHDGRVAYVPAGRLLAADPFAPEELAVRLADGASADAVSRRIEALGGSSTSAAGVTGNGRALVAALSAVLRVVAGVDGLVCLYALTQALALTAQERRRTIAVVRAFGAGPEGVRALLGGAAATVALPAMVIGVALERSLLGPAMATRAAGYAALDLEAGTPEIVAVTVGLALVSAAAVLWVGRRARHESIADGLPA
jgi:ABC-type lipoprotein release transport system permease subunit